MPDARARRLTKRMLSGSSSDAASAVGLPHSGNEKGPEEWILRAPPHATQASGRLRNITCNLQIERLAYTPKHPVFGSGFAPSNLFC